MNSFRLQLFVLTTGLLASLYILPSEEQILVQSRYPQAYQWYCDMATKYPQENLHDIKFCISTHHHAGIDAIFWPESNLKIIDQSYLSPNMADTARQLLNVDEYLLLHEAYHVNQGHVQQGKVTAAVTTAAGSAMAMGSLATASDVTTALVGSASSAAALAATAYAIIRTQESYADDHANQHASKQALAAGIQWHQNNQSDNCCSCSPIAVAQEVYHDPAHPTPQSRAQAAQAAYNQRFEQN